jgi:hypothetical protein
LFVSRHASEEEASSVAEGLGEEAEVRRVPYRERAYEVWALRWNMVGEFKHLDEARGFALGGDQVVAKSSGAERMLRRRGGAVAP